MTSLPARPSTEGLPVGALVATGGIQVTAALIIGAMPAIIGALTNAGRLDVAMAGYIVAVDLAAQVMGTLLFMKHGRHLRWSTAMSVGLLLMVCGNLLSCFSPSIPALIAMRLIAGSGAGIVRSGCFEAFARARDPARAIAFLNVAQTIVMTAAFAAFPSLVRILGWYGPFLAVSALGVLTFAAAPWWPRFARPDTAGAASLEFGRAGTACLLGTSLYFGAQAGIWAFVEAIGAEVGRTSANISSALELSAFPGIAASLLAVAVSARISISHALLGGLCLTLAALYLLTSDGGFWSFTLGLGLFNFAWNATTPFEFASAAVSDRKGNTAAAFPAADGLGMAAGPAIAGTILVQHGATALTVFAAFCTLISIAVFVLAAGPDMRVAPAKKERHA